MIDKATGYRAEVHSMGNRSEDTLLFGNSTGLFFIHGLKGLKGLLVVVGGSDELVGSGVLVLEWSD